MSFYQLLFSRKLNGINRNLTWYWNLFAKYMRENVGTLLAKILKIKGNTIVWNQLQGTVLSTASQGGVTFTHTNDYTITLSNSATSGTSRRTTNDGNPFSIINGHKYLIFGGTDKSGIVFRLYQNGWGDALVDSIPLSGGVVTATMSSNSAFLVMQIANGTNCNNVVIVPQIIDLTQLNDPNITDYDSFIKYYPLPYYSYDTGLLLSFNGSGIKTTGKNLCCYWRDGYIDSSGNRVASAQNGISYPIPLKSGDTIVFSAKTTGSGRGLAVFSSFFSNLIYRKTAWDSDNTIIYTASQNCWVAIWYNYDNAVYMSQSYFDTAEVQIEYSTEKTEYEPYEEHTLSLPISTYFPTGMKSAGNIYDELDETGYITRIGEVDLGSLSWTYDSSVPRFYSTGISAIVKKVAHSYDDANIICPKYSTTNIDNIYQASVNNAIAVSTGGAVSVKDTSYTDATAFKTAMSGVYLYYELATPTEVSIDPPLDLSYEIEWGGTEQLLPENTSTPTTSPISATVEYPDGEHEDYYTYQEIEKNHLRLNRALSIMLGRNVLIENPQEPLNIIMRGE